MALQAVRAVRRPGGRGFADADAVELDARLRDGRGELLEEDPGDVLARGVDALELGELVEVFVVELGNYKYNPYLIII